MEIYSDKDKNFKGLFFQDQQMEVFQAYPELVCIDATYKLLELGLPVNLMLCEDSNGQSENSMTWTANTFKEHNADWKRIRVLMADKDIGERNVLKQSLPNASVLICLFHTLRSFRREITCEKMGITSGQRTLCLDLVQIMAYISSEAEYDLHDQFQQDAPKKVVHYFNDSWHPIRSEWVMGLKSSCDNFLNSTNRLKVSMGSSNKSSVAIDH